MAEYHENIAAAKFTPISPELLQLRLALRGNQEDTKRFIMMLEGGSRLNSSSLRRTSTGFWQTLGYDDRREGFYSTRADKVALMRRGDTSLRRGLAVMLLIVVAGAFLLLSQRRPESFVISPIAVTFPADGRQHAVLRVTRPDGGLLSVSDATAEAIAGSGREDLGDLRVVQTGNELEVLMQAPVMAQQRQVRVQVGRRAVVGKVRFAADDVDSFGDGMPDALRLHSAEDRAAFRQWFWTLAETQAELPDAEKAEEIQDCAALLRYSYREALKSHDAQWAQAEHVGDVAFGSVRQWRYPETMLGTGLFRVRPGPFLPGDENNGTFAQFADAHAVMSWNTHRVGMSLRAAKPGDLIFFKQLEQNSPYHSMVITGRDADWVVYHTGPIGKRKGEMRRMTLADLLHHPDPRWRPVAENSNFLGVFRWNVLREAD